MALILYETSKAAIVIDKTRIICIGQRENPNWCEIILEGNIKIILENSVKEVWNLLNP